ncbi:YCF48-related protein [Sabulibacter ruber]|uniref:YCF48-related protein n=1 Tax=Sabulibacter ruber TaxID=2811901 RepID=UPI001A95C561|nr:YCF48-related protein [Sabulibacter ruber]
MRPLIPKYIFSLVLSLFILFPFLSQAQTWQHQRGREPDQYTNVFAPSAQNLFVTGYPKIGLYSTNSGQTWQNATAPAEVDFTLTHFLNATSGWTVNEAGQLHQTQDGGQTWTPLPSSLRGYPQLLRIISEQSGLVMMYDEESGGSKLYHTQNQGQTWAEADFPEDMLVSNIVMMGQTGYMVGGNSIMKTVDGGRTWQNLTYPTHASGEYGFYHVSFIDAQTGWVLDHHNKSILHTSNGGQTWAATALPENVIGNPSLSFSQFRFQSTTVGFLVDTQHYIYRTTDGGRSWVKVLDQPGQYLQYLDVSADGRTVIALSIMTPNTVYVSTDAGETWQSKREAFVYHDLSDVTFLNTTQGWAVGDAGTLIRTRDGGQAWENVPRPAPLDKASFSKIAFADDQHGWVVASNPVALLATSDGGQNWQAQTLPAHPLGHDYGLNHVFFLKRAEGTNAPPKGWAVGSSGTILRYDGTAWQAHSEFFGVKGMEYTGVYFLEENTGWAVGRNGVIAKSTDGGQTWTRQTSGTLRTLNAVHFTDAHHGWAVGDHDYVLKTIDGGQTWVPQTIPPAFVSHFFDVHFTSAHRGWVTGRRDSHGTILSTTDGGHTWAETELDNRTFAHSFTDLNHGWAVGQNGAVYRFTDHATGTDDQSPAPATLTLQPQEHTLRNFASTIALKDSVVEAREWWETDYHFTGMGNSYIEEFAERFEVSGKAAVVGVVSYHTGVVSAESENVAEFNVFDLDANNLPNRKLGRKDVWFKDMKLDQTAMTTTFNAPVPVENAFYLSLNFTDYAHGGFEGDNLALLHTSNNSRPASDQGVTRNAVRLHSHSGRIWKDFRAEQNYNGYLGMFPIVQFQNVTGLKEQFASNGTLKLYAPFPNPAQGKVQVKFGLAATAEVEVRLVDLNGRTVLQRSLGRKNTGEHATELQLPTSAQGLYILLVQAGDHRMASRLLIQ